MRSLANSITKDYYIDMYFNIVNGFMYLNASNSFGRRMMNQNHWSTHHYRNQIGVMLQHPMRGSILRVNPPTILT